MRAQILGAVRVLRDGRSESMYVREKAFLVAWVLSAVGSVLAEITPIPQAISWASLIGAAISAGWLVLRALPRGFRIYAIAGVLILLRCVAAMVLPDYVYVYLSGVYAAGFILMLVQIMRNDEKKFLPILLALVPLPGLH